MEIIKQLYQIVLRKREPEDLSHDLNTAILVIMTTVFIKYAYFSLINTLGDSFTYPLGYSLTSVAGQSGVIYLMLRAVGKDSRFVQTITALFGISILGGLAMAVMAYSIVLLIAVPLLLFWIVYIQLLILRSSFECSTVIALLITIIFLLVETWVVVLIFPNYDAEVLQSLETIKQAMETAQLEAQSK